jgi:membrane protein implicated in regulation of membrane protease activity
MSQNVPEMLADSEDGENFVRNLVAAGVNSTVGGAAVAGVLTWWRGELPTWWQLIAIAALAIGVPFLRWRRRRARRRAA